MKKGGIYTGYVESVDFPNKGNVIVKTEEDGQTIEEKAVVKNSIPGQTVKFMVNKKKHGKCEGRLLEVVCQADTETNERCEHFGKCGGCVYQTVRYEEQLKMKENAVKKLLAPVINTEYEWEGIIGSPVSSEYRNKMEFSFGDEVKDGPIALGLHKRNSMYDIVTVTGCKIVDNDYRKILKCVYDYALEKNLTYYHKMKHEGYLRHLLVRKAVKTGQILVDIVTTTINDIPMDELADRLKALSLDGEITGFLHTYNDSVADAVINQKTEIVFGKDYIEEELLGLKFKITTFSFFQTNSLGAEVLYSKARDYVGTTKDKVIFDLYSGTGTIAQMLAPVAKKVIGVEIIPEAVEAAKINAGINGLDNCEFIAEGGKVLDGDGNGVVALERESPRQHFVEHDARGVDVRARVRAVAPRLLGRHVVHRAERLLRERVGGIGKAGDAKVGDLDAAVAQDHDVLRLDVAVDDAARMRVRERLHDLRDEMQRFAPVELAALFHILLERDTVDELHDDILRFAAAHVVDRNDIRVREHRDGLRLVAEAAAEVRVLGKVAFEHLDRHKAIEPVALGLVDDRHAAAADDIEQLITIVEHLADHFIHSSCHLLHSQSMSTTVTLSGAPCALASAMSSSRFFSVLSSAHTARQISSSVAVTTSPSVHSSSLSPCASETSNASHCVISSVPSARVIRLRFGCVRASSAVILPFSTSVCTTLWSCVMRVISPPRMR